MPKSIRRKVSGLCFIVLVPILVVTEVILFWMMAIFFAIPFVLIIGGIYAVVLFNGITYGPEQLRQIRIPDAPEHIMNLLELLKTTTIRGDLINVHLVAAFEDEASFNQSALADYVIAQNKISLTPQTIKDRYIGPLERMGIIHSTAVSREKDYRLTPRGELCLEIVKTCFPRTNFWFIVRHHLGIMKLPKHLDTEKEKTMVDFTNK